MSQRVTLDNSGLRSRLRTTPVTHRVSNYQTRTNNAAMAIQPGAAQAVIADVSTSKAGGSSAVVLKPQVVPIEQLIVFPAVAEKELESVANAVARQRAEVLAIVSARKSSLTRPRNASDLSFAKASSTISGFPKRTKAASRSDFKGPFHSAGTIRQPEPVSQVPSVQPDKDATPEPAPLPENQNDIATVVRRSAVWQPARPDRTPQIKSAETRQAKKRHLSWKFKLSQTKLLMSMATIVFVVGIGVSVMGIHANRQAAAQALAVSKQVDQKAATATTGQTADAGAPSTTPVSSAAVKSYVVAPDLPRYITIPSIGVHARVLQVGVTNDGALGTPSNVFDAAWYTGSAKPGQPGASLIDGHVSSWTSHGVFYNIKSLTPGDKIQIEKGDGQMLNYSVVKTVAFDANNVDMQSLMVSADSSKPGLNLITCGGSYDRNSKEFTQRIAVYAVLQ